MTAPDSASEILMDAANYFGESLAVADERAWQHLLVYCPKHLRATSVTRPTDAELVEAIAIAIGRHFRDAKSPPKDAALAVLFSSAARAALSVVTPYLIGSV